jgi:hypothetical protein
LLGFFLLHERKAHFFSLLQKKKAIARPISKETENGLITGKPKTAKLQDLTGSSAPKP